MLTQQNLFVQKLRKNKTKMKFWGAIILLRSTFISPLHQKELISALRDDNARLLANFQNEVHFRTSERLYQSINDSLQGRYI